ncbi:MAG TPA: toll/interleukin-1 receptor domain-containing protein [Thermoleophilaceae bacterium]|jgi:hypothetical protein
MGGIFISYRRQDAPGYAGRLYDSLAAHYGDDRIFMDIGAIQPGQDFSQRIDEALSSCDVLLAIIGPQWATVTAADGSRRLDDPEDYVGLEVHTALRRPDVTVIPVLVAGAQMPAREEVPPSLADLRRRQALELSEGRWRYDVDRLIATLEGPVQTERTGLSDRARHTEDATTTTSSYAAPLMAVALGMLVAAGPAYGAYSAGLNLRDKVVDPQITADYAKTIGHFALGWAGFWAVLAAVVAAVVAAMGPDKHLILPKATRGLLLGAVCGGIGGAVNGAIRVNDLHGEHTTLGVVVGFAVTGGLFGLTRIAGRSLSVGVVAGAAGGAVGGLLLAGTGKFPSQALPAALILMGIAALQAMSTTTSVEHQPAPAALTPLQRLQRH